MLQVRLYNDDFDRGSNVWLWRAVKTIVKAKNSTKPAIAERNTWKDITQGWELGHLHPKYSKTDCDEQEVKEPMSQGRLAEAIIAFSELREWGHESGFEFISAQLRTVKPTRYSGGGTTLARAALFNTLLRGQGKETWHGILAQISDQLSGRGLNAGA